MANNPRKVKDPTEVALSAIQEALNIADVPSNQLDRMGRVEAEAGRNEPPPLQADDRPVQPPLERPLPSLDDYAPTMRASNERLASALEEEPSFNRRAANDDRETIGQLLQAIQKGRPGRNAYLMATIFAAVWFVAVGILTVAFLPSLREVTAQGGGGVLTIAGLAALFVLPMLLFYFLASLAWRGQELRMIAQSMAQVAIRFSEPEGSIRDSMVTVGQAIRREVAAMGDGVERAIARAGELESLVSNEVAALERAYSDNELRQDIAVISDAIASRVDEVAKSITTGLQERGDHISRALGNAGDSMILALGERGGDLLDRFEEASAETTRAVMEASERLTASLNFKTGHVHDDFVD